MAPTCITILNCKLIYVKEWTEIAGMNNDEVILVIIYAVATQLIM